MAEDPHEYYIIELSSFQLDNMYDFHANIAILLNITPDHLDAASQMGIPTLIQEQNSYAGVTNKHLAGNAAKICVAYEGMERFFPADRIINTGNPVRQSLIETTMTHDEAVSSFGLDPEKKTILLVGGSLGARTVNESVMSHLDLVEKSGVQFIWQTGKFYSTAVAERLKDHRPLPMLKVMDFISDMGAAYKAADLVISRALRQKVSLHRDVSSLLRWL